MTEKIRRHPYTTSTRQHCMAPLEHCCKHVTCSFLQKWTQCIGWTKPVFVKLIVWVLSFKFFNCSIASTMTLLTKMYFFCSLFWRWKDFLQGDDSWSGDGQIWTDLKGIQTAVAMLIGLLYSEHRLPQKYTFEVIQMVLMKIVGGSVSPLFVEGNVKPELRYDLPFRKLCGCIVLVFLYPD